MLLAHIWSLLMNLSLEVLIPAESKKYDMTMRCYVNGELLSTGNTKDMKWTFAEIIERSHGVELFQET